LISLHAPQPIPKALPDVNVAWVDGRQGVVQLIWRSGLLEQVRSFVGSTYVSRNGNGTDVGGVFYGRKDGEQIHVTTWRPIVRGKDATAHFYLDSKDEQNLGRMLKSAGSDPTLDGTEVVGWFRSRSKGEPVLDSQDIRFHEKLLDLPWQFAMVIRPSHQRPAEAGIFLRNSEGDFEPNHPTAKMSLLPGPVGVSANAVGSVAIPDVTLFDGYSAPKRSFPMRLVASVLALAVFVAFGAIFLLQWNEQREAALRPADGLGFELVFDGEDLKARWNPASPAILSADNAQLLLGGERVQLSHAELAQGFLRVPMKPGGLGDTEVSLRVGDREEVAQLITAAR